MKKNKLKYQAILVFFCSLMIMLLINLSAEKSSYQQNKEFLSYLGESYVSKIENVMDDLLARTQVLEALLIQGNGTIKDFDSFAATMMDDPSIRSLQLAPNGVVTQIYPLKGNEAGFMDLFADPERSSEALYTKESGQLTLSGPFHLAQGGFGCVGRRPIYLKDQQGNSTFWGFTIIVIDMPQALEPSGIQEFKNMGISYKIHRVHPTTKTIQIIDESEESPLVDPVDLHISLANTNWTFSLSYQSSWLTTSTVMMNLFHSAFSSTLLASVFYFFRSLNEKKKELLELSVTDTLTQTYNRRYLDKTIMKLMSQQTPFTLCYIDIDKFKYINDTFGHDIGDEYLRIFANRIKEQLDANDILFRIGGDEFVVILMQRNITQQINEIEASVKQQIHSKQHSFTPEYSIGIASYPVDGTTLEELMQLADKRMYQHKKQQKETDSHSE